MAFRPPLIAFLCLAVVIRLSGAGATPEKVSLNGLVTNSPFGSPKSGVTTGSNGGEPFEFRAVLEENNSKFFSIYETATRRSNWVELNDPVNGFAVKSYDAAKESITVDYQGKSITLAIKRAPAVAQVMQQPPQPMPGPNGIIPPQGNPAAQAGQAGPTAVDQQRIQQIQEEIRRRRALRSQAATPGGATAGPQPNYNNSSQPNYGNGPQLQPSNATGPMPQASSSVGPQPLPPKTNP
jgi:hypothetical protein